jgi:hypothetical protein
MTKKMNVNTHVAASVRDDACMGNSIIKTIRSKGCRIQDVDLGVNSIKLNETTSICHVRSSSGHQLFISAFMISSKAMCDDTYSNKSWSVIAQGMFNLREINQME